MEKPATKTNLIQKDAWAPLKKFTNARIAVGRTGHAIPLAENLRFRADHARARDAVYTALDMAKLEESLHNFVYPNAIPLKSLALNRQEYLQRPDLGRQLHEESKTVLKEAAGQNHFDIAVIIADGLSAQAVEMHAPVVLGQLLPLLAKENLTVAPVCVAQLARVAISDEVGHLLNSRLSVILIGERPGLSSPHSMGIYITYKPTIGNTDESRNCISNIHPQGGLSYQQAAEQSFSLIKSAFALQLSGVHLKSGNLLK